MTAAVVYYPHAIDLPGSAASITQLTDLSPAYNFADFIEYAAGQPAPQWSGSITSAPTIPFQTRQIKAVLDACLTTAANEGVAFNGGGANTDVYFKKGSAYGLRTADATDAHIRCRIAGAASVGGMMLYWSQITAAQGQAAEIMAHILPVWDGTNDPCVFTTEPLAVTPAVEQVLTLGPISLNGTALEGVQSITISSGVVPEVVMDAGQPFPTYVGVARYQPIIQIQGRNGDWMEDFGSRSTAFSAAPTLYLRALLQNGITDADASTTHIKATQTGAYAGTIKARRLDNRGSVELTVIPVKPAAATAVLTWTTGVAIT